MGSVILRNKLEEAIPTYDNNFIDLVLKTPPEWRFRHHIYRKFLKKLAPELARIPYNHTMLPADAPLVLWKLGSIYQYRKEKIKKEITKISGGRILLYNKRGYVNFDEWFRLNENWNRFIKDTVLSKSALLNEFLNQEYVEALIKQHESGKIDNSGKLAYLVTFELFLRMFLMNNEQSDT